MTQKEKLLLASVALLTGIVIGALRDKATAQVPAPEPAVDNLIAVTADPNWLGDDMPIYEYGESVVYVLDTLQKKAFLKWGIGLWQQYKAECYADSSRELIDMESNSSGNTLLYIPPKIIWTHKEYSAEGFFDWLEGKVK